MNEEIRKQAEHDIKKFLWCFLNTPDLPDGMVDTPRRVVSAFEEMTAGYKMDPKSICTVFPNDHYDEMILVTNIDFASLCEHHLLPFTGVAHVAYVPGNTIIGLSKIPRLVDIYSRRFQIQERLTDQIARTLRDLLQDCLGTACVIEAHHTCACIRGVKKHKTYMITSSLTGCFKEEVDCRSEFMELIKLNRNKL
jgi:GTP cyclohydrolase I